MFGGEDETAPVNRTVNRSLRIHRLRSTLADQPHAFIQQPLELVQLDPVGREFPFVFQDHLLNETGIFTGSGIVRTLFGEQGSSGSGERFRLRREHRVRRMYHIPSKVLDFDPGAHGQRGHELGEDDGMVHGDTVHGLKHVALAQTDLHGGTVGIYI